MSLRYRFLGVIAIALASGQGCCTLRCWPYGKTWCGSQCGDLIWNEWFSLPPDCQEFLATIAATGPRQSLSAARRLQREQRVGRGRWLSRL